MNILFALLGASAAPPEAVSVHMQHHFRDATIGLEAWISGDRATAVRFLERVGQHPIAPGLPKNAAARVGQMQALAKRAASPAPVGQTARTFADLGAACGACHQANKVQPVLLTGEPPAKSGALHPHMAGHLWAVRALWMALITNDHATWKRGAEHLSSDALHQDAFGVGPLNVDLQRARDQVHQGGRHALVATDLPGRLTAFAEVVEACGSCHLEMRGE